jgi:hypothetical protein
LKKNENLTLKIPFEEILPSDIHLYGGTRNSPNLSILVGVLIENVPFSTFDLENYCQGHIFSRSKYQKRVVGENLKILSYHTFRSVVWFELLVG